MKKFFLIFLNIVLVSLLCGASYFLFMTWRGRTLHHFIADKQLTMRPKAPFVLREGNVGSHHILAYFPADKDGKAIQSMEAVIDGVVREEIGEKAPSGHITNLAFVTFEEGPSQFSTVQNIRLHQTMYQVGLFAIQGSGQKELGTFLLTQEYELFTMDHLFKDKEKLLSILSSIIQEKKALPSATSLEEIEQKLKGVDTKEISIDYQNSQLTFSFPEESGIADLTVAIDQLYDVIDEKYLSEVDAKAYEEYRQKKAAEKMIALTFDDGPNPATTPQILDTLKRHNAKATFFILGQNIPGNEAILKRIVSEGHEVANHTMTHPNLTSLSVEQIRQEIENTQQLIKEVTGKTPVIMRPPYGAFNKMVMDTMGLPAIHWGVDTLDWQHRNPQAILQIVQSATYPGSIILMHDIHQPTADGLPAVMEYLAGQGYSFGTVSELLGSRLNPQHVYYDRTHNEPAQ